MICLWLLGGLLPARHVPAAPSVDAGQRHCCVICVRLPSRYSHSRTQTAAMHHTHRACYALLLLLLLAQLAATTVAYLDPRAGQLSPSVLLVGEWDWQESTGSDGKPWSRCLDMVWRARSVVSGNRLNFVPTHQVIPPSFWLHSVCSLCEWWLENAALLSEQGSRWCHEA